VSAGVLHGEKIFCWIFSTRRYGTGDFFDGARFSCSGVDDGLRLPLSPRQKLLQRDLRNWNPVLFLKREYWPHVRAFRRLNEQVQRVNVT
jgi:hypothetical protein